MLLPIGDHSAARVRPAVVTPLLIVGTAAIFLWQLVQARQGNSLIDRYGMIPSEVMREPWTLATSVFLHGGLMHLAMNMLFLWIFGDNVESAMGGFWFLLFYLLAGAASSLLHTAIFPQSSIPCIGASGAIAGVIGVYAVWFPRNWISALLWPLPPIIIPVPALFYLAIWLAGQVFTALYYPDLGGVAYWAHIGGFACGALVALQGRPKSPPRRAG